MEVRLLLVTLVTQLSQGVMGGSSDQQVILKPVGLLGDRAGGLLFAFISCSPRGMCCKPRAEGNWGASLENTDPPPHFAVEQTEAQGKGTTSNTTFFFQSFIYFQFVFGALHVTEGPSGILGGRWPEWGCPRGQGSS